MKLLLNLNILCLIAAAPIKDLVDQLPGFSKTTFKVYSGLLHVPGPINGYDSLKIHYQFHCSQSNPSKDPVVVWHQGGPGGSSIVGAYLEMGFFQVSDNGTYTNPWAWNRISNMLYLESPAGSGQQFGYSECLKAGKPMKCSWNDENQAEAYAHTLQAFFAAFPEFSKNELFLTGESYFGQYGPNIAHFVLNNEPFNTNLNLRGIAVGNGCWGEQCNGPNAEKNDVDNFFGKALFSRKLHSEIYSACNFSGSDHLLNGLVCQAKLLQMRHEVGPHNVYNIYDNCPQTQAFLEKSGKDMGWLVHELRVGMADPIGTHQRLMRMSGGYPWACKSISGISQWLVRPDVRKALHLDKATPGASEFAYIPFNPLSITLYPELVKKIRVLIYNGDADACVPYTGNEEWVDGLEAKGILKVERPWTPWYTSNRVTPAGYLTQYSVPGSGQTFEFQTVRLAGHMVPSYQPEAAFTLLERFITAPKHDGRVVV
jgi:hypothetical protein|mmetsp:Transcript_50346/g.79771  ORF Transcript_50346/g.79771 Transcript_50346/m.79771 type:complete len:484 (+) Transcript_50346:68-1519(+)